MAGVKRLSSQKSFVKISATRGAGMMRRAACASLCVPPLLKRTEKSQAKKVSASSSLMRLSTKAPHTSSTCSKVSARSPSCSRYKKKPRRAVMCSEWL